MKARLPQLPEKDGKGRFFAFLQLICFAALFLVIYLPLRAVVSPLWARILILIADYIAVSLVTFFFIKPFFEKLEEKSRKK